MWRVARLFAVMMLVFVPNTVMAQSTPWEFAKIDLKGTNEKLARVSSMHADGGLIHFSCLQGRPRSKFMSMVATAKSDHHSSGSVEIAWRIDDEVAERTSWQANRYTRSENGVLTEGEDALRFASAVARAQRRVVFRDENGTAIFDVRGSTKAIAQLLAFCGLN